MGNILRNRNRASGFGSGFTLIEMIIVITIIAVLAILAANSFGVARQRARLTVAVDSVMSLVKQQQQKAKTGRNGCHGIMFKKSEPSIQTVLLSYIAVPQNSNSPYADYCDTQVGAVPLLTPVEVADDIFVENIEQKGSAFDSLVIMFKPPFGAVLQASTLEQIAPKLKIENAPVKIFLNQKTNQKQDHQGFQFDPISGLVTRFTGTSFAQP